MAKLELAYLVRKADLNGGYVSCYGFGNSIIDNIELGTLPGRYEAFIEENRPRRIEVWLHLKRPISAEECDEFKCISENNTLGEDDIKMGNLYDYHLSCFPVPWLADIFPKLLATTM